MKSFLSKLTFAQVMIAGCLVGSIVLGVLIFQNHRKISEQSAALEEEGSAARLVREIQSLSDRYSTLYRGKGDEKLRAQDNPQTYIQGIAGDPKVQVGRVNINVSTRALTGTIKDSVYSVTPFLNDDTFKRSQIANFLWKLESDSRRVRVTELSIRALDQNGKPMRSSSGEYPSDDWTFTCKVTSRQREGEEGG